MEIARPTKVIIIAAGRGRRLMPYTDRMPKCLVPVAGVSILARQLAAFRAHGITEFVVIRGYLGQVLDDAASELGPGVRFVDNRDFENNNILESLFCAADDIAGPVLMTYADIVFTEKVVADLMAAPGEICLTIDRDFAAIYDGRTEHPLSEAEVADLHDDGRVRRVGKRALPAEAAWGEFIGLGKLSGLGASWLRQAWEELCHRYRDRRHEPFQRAPSFRQAYLTDLLQHLIDAGRPMTPVAIRGGWREIDTVQDLERAEALLGSAQETWI